MRQSVARWRRVPVSVAAVTLLGCSALPPPQAAQFLDERTGISLTVVDRPIVLARERRDIAAHARDYLTLVAAERNAAGQKQLILLVHRWSTIDRRVVSDSNLDRQELVLIADGRDVKLIPLTSILPTEFTQSEKLWRPPVTEAATTAYRLDRQLLLFLASSAKISAFYSSSDIQLGYTIWQYDRAALQRFIDAIGPSP